MEEFKAPVKALNDDILEQVSGGAVDPMGVVNVIAVAYNQFSQLATGVLSPWVENINETAFKIKYKKPLEVLATYNNDTTWTLEEKAAIYAASWNKKHPHAEPMSENLAMYILSIQNSGAQVAIACLPDVNQMINAYSALANGGS